MSQPLHSTPVPELPRRISDYYSRPESMSDAGRHAGLLQSLPSDVAALTEIVQGLAIHQYAASYYGVTVPEARKRESHIRPVETILDEILALDGRPLAEARPPEKRIVGVCHHFALLLVAMLRAHGIPARYRSGFGSYFNAPYFEDHVVCEYWSAEKGRWVLADPQFDEKWRAGAKIDHDVLDVPRDRYLTAADAWSQCRSGKADPSKFGIFAGEQRGFWFIAGDLVRDIAGLNKAEMLPWDCWGAMPDPNEQLSEDQFAFFDRIAELTRDPDAAFDELRRAYEGDERLRVPKTVFNAVLQRPEAVEAA
jgi:hypothetical protein